MPVEHLNVFFKPQHFFRANPALDVPAADDKKSCAAFGAQSESRKSCCAQ